MLVVKPVEVWVLVVALPFVMGELRDKVVIRRVVAV